MARITAESLMAPGGLLDAGSRLTQTLINVPFQRQQFKAGLDERALMIQREDDRIAKTDKVGYLKDRIATNQQRIAELRRALMLGDKTEASVLLKAMGKTGGTGDPKAMLDHAARVADHEAKLREELKTKLGAKFASNETEDDIKAAVAKFEQNDIARMKAKGLWHDDQDALNSVMGGKSLKGIDVDMIKADPQLQQELDAALDQQSQLFDQYRQLVGHAQDVVETRSFLQSQLPNEAPQAPGEKPALGPPGSNPEDYENLPQSPPMVTTAADANTAYSTALNRLDSPEVLASLANNTTPGQLDVMGQQQITGAPELDQGLSGVNALVTQGQEAGLRPGELAAAQSRQQTMQASKQATLRNALSMAAFQQVTPETLAATDQILATVHPAGQQMLWEEIVGTQKAAREPAKIPGSQANMAGGLTNPAATFSGPRITPHLVPRLQRLAPPGTVSPQQAELQRRARAGLSSAGF